MRPANRPLRPILVATMLVLSPLATHAYMADKEKLDKAAAACNAGNYKEGAAQFKVLANDGDAFSQCLLGVMYQNGRGVPKNVNTAISWYMKAAKQGCSNSEVHLGDIYLYGEQGIKKNDKVAADWYRRAAHHGSQNAQMALFKMFISSHFGDEAAEARAWLARACQAPGELTEEAHKAWANLSPVKEMAQVQNNFENEYASVAVLGTQQPAPGQVAPTAQPVSKLLHQPDGLVGALEEHWDKVADLDKQLSAEQSR